MQLHKAMAVLRRSGWTIQMPIGSCRRPPGNASVDIAARVRLEFSMASSVPDKLFCLSFVLPEITNQYGANSMARLTIYHMRAEATSKAGVQQWTWFPDVSIQ